MNGRSYLSGIYLILIGLLFLLLNLNVLSFEWLLFLLSIGILIGYMMKKHLGYLLLGLILLGVSVMSILDQYVFIGIDIKRFLFLWIFGIICLAVYGKQNNRILLTIGLLLIALGTNNLINELVSIDVNWTLYFLFGIAFYMAYLLGFRKDRIEWPKYLGTVMFLISILYIISAYTSIEFGFWKLVFNILPIALILIGIRIIYNAKKLGE